MGCFVETSAFPIIFSSRARVLRNRSRLRSRVFALARATLVSSAMNETESPSQELYTTVHTPTGVGAELSPARPLNRD
jgi:hypothetical protein